MRLSGGLAGDAVVVRKRRGKQGRYIVTALSADGGRRVHRVVTVPGRLYVQSVVNAAALLLFCLELEARENRGQRRAPYHREQRSQLRLEAL